MSACDSGRIDTGSLPPAGAQVVYRLCVGDTVLYVGVTNHLLRRLSQHLSGAMRHKFITHIEWVEYDSRYEAEIIEAQTIKTLQPEFNIIGLRA
jgi:excinuclease UvrABC nuclease subunit